MNRIEYKEYKEYTCDKCNDRYYSRLGSFSDRSSCRFHHFILIGDIWICRDCKQDRNNIRSNCYHVKKADICCCIIS